MRSEPSNNAMQRTALRAAADVDCSRLSVIEVYVA